MAAIPGTTTIDAYIAPRDDRTKKFTHTEEWNRGGYRTVPDIEARDALLQTQRWAPGMLVNVLSVDTVFRLTPKDPDNINLTDVSTWEFTKFTTSGDAVQQGPAGEQGIQGPQGEQGIQGPAGENGKSAYDIAVEEGFEGDKSEAGAPGTTSVSSDSLAYTLLPTDDLATIINSGKKLINLKPDEIYTWNDVVLTNVNNLVINGNNATVKPADDQHGCLSLVTCNGITIENIKFLGSSTNVGQTDYRLDHWAIKFNKGFNCKVIECYFRNWAGGAIGCTASGSGSSSSENDNYYDYALRIAHNLFDRCQIGLAAVGRFEFGLESNNRFYNCCIGVYSEAGNWSHIGSKFTAVYNPYVSISYSGKALNARINGSWFAGPANTGHGTLCACEFNHSTTGGGCSWSQSAKCLRNTSNNSADTTTFATATGQNERGIEIYNTITPTFTGNTLYYCNINGRNVQEGRMIFTGNVLTSSCTIKNHDNPNKWFVLGHSYHTGCTLSNVTDLDNMIMSANNNTATVDLSPVNSKVSELESQIAALKNAIKDLNPDAVLEVVKAWQAVQDTDVSSWGGGKLTNGSLEIKDSGSNAGILFNTNITAIEFDIDPNGNEFGTFGIVGATDDNAIWVLAQGWATSAKDVTCKWQKVSQGGFNTGSKGTVESNIGWPTNYSVAPKAHIKLTKESNGLKYEVSYPNGTYSGNYSAKTVTLALPTSGTFRLGLVASNGSNKTTKLINIKVYR